MLDYTSPLVPAPEAPLGYWQLNAASRFLELGSLQMVLRIHLGACVWKCWPNTLKQMLSSGEGNLEMRSWNTLNLTEIFP